MSQCGLNHLIGSKQGLTRNQALKNASAAAEAAIKAFSCPRKEFGKQQCAVPFASDVTINVRYGYPDFFGAPKRGGVQPWIATWSVTIWCGKFDPSKVTYTATQPE